MHLSFVCTENEIAKIPAHTSLELPNLEWLDLSKNKLDTRGLHPHAFKIRMALLPTLQGSLDLETGRSWHTFLQTALLGGAAGCQA